MFFSKGTVEYIGSDPEYQLFWKMVTHRQSRSEESLLKCYIITLFLIRCLRLTSYIKDENKGEALSDTELHLGMIMFHLFLVQDMNSHPVFALDSQKNKAQIGLDNIGSGIYPTIGSFFNHSCNANTIRVNVQRKQLLLATTRIPEGEEICDIYSMHYTEIAREDRQRWLLERFHFHCKCKACEENWSTFTEIDSEISPELRSKLEMVERGIQQSIRSGGETGTTLNLHLRHVELIQDLPQPHTLHALVRNSFLYACWRHYGNMKETDLHLA